MSFGFVLDLGFSFGLGWVGLLVTLFRVFSDRTFGLRLLVFLGVLFVLIERG